MNSIDSQAISKKNFLIPFPLFIQKFYFYILKIFTFLKVNKMDPRWIIAGILCSYNILGLTILGFNRSFTQMFVTTILTCAFEVILCYLVHKKLFFPLSSLITSFSLSLLLDYSHSYWLLTLPVFFAVGSKYLLTYKGRHFFNPALSAVTFSLLFSHNLITAAPAYQWNGIGNLYIFMALLGSLLLLPKINRHWLVISFLVTFTLQTALRAWIMKHHLPFETLFFGTLTSPSFILFTFFMITDPATSPKTTRDQIIVGFFIALIDLSFHLFQSYYTFFYAGFTVALVRFFWFHLKDFVKSPASTYFENIVKNKYPRKLLFASAIGFASYSSFYVVLPTIGLGEPLNWTFHLVKPSDSGLDSTFGNLYDRTDPRIQHIVKWIFGVGDSVSVGDFDNDGNMDVFLTNMLKDDSDRAALYKNIGNNQFERIPLEPAELFKLPEVNGMPTNALFIDYDNDGDKDLFVSVAFGSNRLFKNLLIENKKLEWEDVTSSSGLFTFGNSISANFFDMNRDGLLDIFVGNVLPEHFPDYDKPELINLFHLPQPQYQGDDRMFNFMHSSWHLADNGGVNKVYLQKADHTFELMDSEKLGLTQTRWSLAIGTADFNQDGWTDIYVANDFGPDDLYLNQNGTSFYNLKGKAFGSIGKDTYKGMNASQADLDNNGWLDEYVSNVHHALQAEGSLAWMFSENKNNKFIPIVKDKATQLGLLNESRFGWGASLEDFNNDGWVDVAQANGMVDDRIDKKFDECPDYWYVNEKIARSAPEIHRYANKWGDIRGMCIYGLEQNRLYLNQGNQTGSRFIDVANQVGFTEKTNSRGMAAIDYNNDGKLDLLVSHMFQPTDFFINKNLNDDLVKDSNDLAKADNHWIKFNLISDKSECNRQALGSIVRVKYVLNGKSTQQIREVQAATGFSAQSDPRIHFGLGSYSGDVSVSIKWCNQWLKDYTLAPDQIHTLRF